MQAPVQVPNSIVVTIIIEVLFSHRPNRRPSIALRHFTCWLEVPNPTIMKSPFKFLMYIKVYTFSPSSSERKTYVKIV